MQMPVGWPAIGGAHVGRATHGKAVYSQTGPKESLSKDILVFAQLGTEWRLHDLKKLLNSLIIARVSDFTLFALKDSACNQYLLDELSWMFLRGHAVSNRVVVVLRVGLRICATYAHTFAKGKVGQDIYMQMKAIVRKESEKIIQIRVQEKKVVTLDKWPKHWMSARSKVFFIAQQCIP